MFEKRKVWVGVGSALASSLVVTSASADQPASVYPATTMVAPGPMMEGEGGEGEGEGAVSVNLAENDAQFLAQLGLIRGHLWVGMTLYEQGHIEMAKTHMKHPGDELYAGLVSAFEARGLPGFADELQALADAVNNDNSRAVVENAYSALKQAISVNEPVAEMTAGDVLKSISSMLITAADEYAIGINEGKVVNVHEYQDAYGFQQIALARLEAISAAEQQRGEAAIAETRRIIEGLTALWPTTTPEGMVEGDASRIYGAASRIELEANSI